MKKGFRFRALTDLEVVVTPNSKLQIIDNDSRRIKGKGILIEENLGVQFGNNKRSGYRQFTKPNTGKYKIVGSGPISFTQQNIGRENDEGTVGLGIAEPAAMSLKGAMEIGEQWVDFLTRMDSKVSDITLSRLEFLNSLIQNEDNETEGSFLESQPPRKKNTLKVAMASDYMVAEAVDVTTSKTTTGLDPSKHSAVVFKANQDEQIGGLIPRDSDGTSTHKKIKLRKKDLGSRLKVASTSKNFSKLIQPKSNNFNAGHNNLVPLKESMKKLAESISTELDSANLNMGNEHPVTQGNTS